MPPVEIEFETTQSLSFVPGFSESPAKIEGLQVATVRRGSASPGTGAGTGEQWYAWANGTLNTQANYDWADATLPTPLQNSKIMIRNGNKSSDGKAASDQHATDLSSWHIKIDPTTKGVQLWDDRRWGFYTKP